MHPGQAVFFQAAAAGGDTSAGLNTFLPRRLDFDSASGNLWG
jgi:hypothetical protein